RLARSALRSVVRHQRSPLVPELLLSAGEFPAVVFGIGLSVHPEVAERALATANCGAEYPTIWRSDGRAWPRNRRIRPRTFNTSTRQNVIDPARSFAPRLAAPRADSQ